MTIDASLFAHIENDAHLAGTFKLEGQQFSKTSQYLEQYLQHRQSLGKNFPPKYSELLQDMKYLVSIENQMLSPKPVSVIAEEITGNLSSLQIGERIQIPGGWCNSDGGHAMVYQFTRTKDGYHFTAINAGAGIEYHQKKSGLHKELYNPTKTWHFPVPASAEDKTELGFFIERLLKARKFSSANRSPMTQKKLYEAILPTISHFGGTEIHTNTVPESKYTGGSLSGTCAQRCQHQMLKINSESNEQYESFIFDFKHYALTDYVEACSTGKQPFTESAREQINLAIDNNLKILNNPGVFTEIEVDSYTNELLLLRKKITHLPLVVEPKLGIKPAPVPNLTIRGNNSVAPSPNYSMPHYDMTATSSFNLKSKNFLLDFNNAVKLIKEANTPALQYFYLEQLITALPFDSGDSLYKDLSALSEFEFFSNGLDTIQEMLQGLQKTWLNEAQIPALHIMVLSTMALQMNIKANIANLTKVPSFKPFVAATIGTVISNTERNPYWATNQPSLDQKYKELQRNFAQAPAEDHDSFYHYLIALLATEPELDNKLKLQYDQLYGHDTSDLHAGIRRKGLKSLYLISLEISNRRKLSYEFNPIVTKIRTHLRYESQLRRSINPFFEKQLTEEIYLEFVKHENSFLLYSSLYPSFITWQDLSNKLTKSKDPGEESPALEALKADTSTTSRYKNFLKSKTANNIQLKPTTLATDQSGNRSVTQADIMARDYFHLRSVPSLQINLTIDYFTRHIAKLSSKANQHYIEANLLQPGLLLDALQTSRFFPQFDRLLGKGWRYFNKDGQATRESLLFLRLDFLVSRYLYLTNPAQGIIRLQAIQEQLLKQLAQPNDPGIIYVQQQYLFLTLMSQINLETDQGELFALATDAYFYIQSHANPFIHHDTNHRVEVDAAIAKFQILAKKFALTEPERIKLALEKSLAKNPATKELQLLKAGFPCYELGDNKTKRVSANFLLGKLFEGKLARSSVPLAIKNHELIKHLELEGIQDCLMTADEKHLILSDKDKEVRLFYSNNQLTVQKKWTIEGSEQLYELQALGRQHLALQANTKIPLVDNDLPEALRDNRMDYWQSTLSRNKGLLVKNNIPLYYFKNSQVYALDKQGKMTGEVLVKLDGRWHSILNQFESNQFIVAQADSLNTVIQLPRYNLNFKIENNSHLILQETAERIVENPPSIHPKVAGLTLQRDEHLRFIMPVARFYATVEGAKKGDFYPVIHDTSTFVANDSLDKHWQINPPQRKPLWDYQQSEQYLSYRIQDGELIANNVSDALYLTYTYLATNQPEKAWKTLEDCNTRLGGLTGNPQELQFIAWICKDLPYLEQNFDKDAIKMTPPYVACQLKALGLLTDYLSQDQHFDLKEPRVNDSANSHYQLVQHETATRFIKALPETIYTTFSRLQTMRRHLEHHYQLSKIERTRLLDYYHQAQSLEKTPWGALGYEWMCLSLEALQDERKSILARIDTSMPNDSDSNRLKLIDEQLAQIKPVVAKSTILEQRPIDLSLPANSKIDQSYLSPQTIKILESWQSKLPTNDQQSSSELNHSMKLLSSNISEQEFITQFPNYFQIAFSKQDQALKKRLLDFCQRTLIASHHLSLADQESNIPLLSNVLYRVLSNQDQATCLSYLGDLSLKTLIEMISNWPIPSISIYQAKDVYQEILATKETLLAKESLKPIPLKTKKLSKTAFLEEDNIHQYLETQNRQTLDQLILSYRELSKEHLAKINLATTEEEAGRQLLAFEQAQKNLGKCIIEDPALALLIQNMTAAVDKPLATKADLAWQKALSLANQGPDNPKQKKIWDIGIESKARAKLTKADLLSIFCCSEASFSCEKTGLSAEKTQELHDLIQTAIFHEIQSSVIKKIIIDLEKSIKTVDIALATQLLDVLAKTEIPGLNEPSVALLQMAEEILLRPRQATAIKSLVKPSKIDRGFKEKVEKIMPGGGKSKVLLPILAEQKARGDNLVVIEVPPSLLATNHVDLNRISQRLFGKKAYRFEFDRDKSCSPKQLKKMYKLFREIATTRCYMVSAPDSIKSLQLKYVDLLLLKEEDREKDWAEQVYWLDKITGFLKSDGDCLNDEIHQGLWIKKKLNYTTDGSVPISPDLIKNSIALYSFIDRDFIINAPKLADNYDWSSFKKELAEKVLNHTNSPLNSFFKQALFRFGSKVEAELIAYLMDSSENQCEAVVHAKSDEKQALGFFKQQISQLLTQTLTGKLNVTYGASKRKNLSPIEATLAIPYLGNDIADEHSRFGNVLVFINNSIQMMIIKGISRELFIERVAEWQALARMELSQNTKLKFLDETPTARGFALLEGNRLTLSQIDINTPEQMEPLHQQFQHNRSLQSPILEERGLKLIHHDGGIIPGDSFNHVDQYRSYQGVSGTPDNHTTFHQRLKYNKKTALGTDAYLVELLRSKNTALSFHDFENIEQFIETILLNSTNPENCRAIIDINATLTAVTNLDFAKAIIAFNKKHSDFFSNPIKHILYSNEEQVLCALDVSKPDVPIILGTSDEKEIARILRSKPEERFSCYDQVHTFGLDLKQFKQAHAIVLIDEKDYFERWVQGCKRMREVGDEQTEEFVLPTRVKGMTYQGLVDRLKENSKKALNLDNLVATKEQMHNFMRQTCLSFIQNLPSQEAISKSELMKQFEPFFKDVPIQDLFLLYGSVTKKQSLEEIFKQTRKQLLTIWKDCHSKANRELSAENYKATKSQLKAIVEIATPYCSAEYDGLEQNSQDFQVQNQVHKQTFVEQLDIKTVYDSSLNEAHEHYWLANPFEKLIGGIVQPLNKRCPSKTGEPLFSSTLHMSRNFAETYRGQKETINGFLKPVFLVWYHLHYDTVQEKEILNATIVIPQELGMGLRNCLSKSDSWIATTQDTVVCGNPPKMLTAEVEESYQTLREQVRFFNGEFSSLLDQDTPLFWLKDNLTEKLNFFENNLQVYRPGSDIEFQQLKAALTQGNLEGFIHIAKHPFVDHRNCEWKALIPSTIPAQAAEYQKVAEAFNYMNNHWHDENIELKRLEELYGFPLSALGYVNDHLQHLLGLKQFLNQNVSCAQPFLAHLPENAKASFETYLGMPLDSFYARHQLKSSEPQAKDPKWQIASLDAINILSHYPALESKKSIFTRAINDLAKVASSPEVLIALLKEEVSPTLITNLLQNPCCSVEVVQLLLDSSFTFTEIMQQALAHRCQNNHLIDQFLTRIQPSEKTLQILCEHKFLTESQLLVVLRQAQHAHTLTLVYNHPGAMMQVRDALIQHKAHSAEFITSCLFKMNLKSAELLQILKHDHAVNEEVLIHAVKLSGDPEVQLSAIRHPKSSPQVWTIALASSFLPEVVSEIIKATTVPRDHVFLKNFLKRAFQASLQPSEKEKWENILIALLDKYPPEEQLAEELIAIFGQEATQINTKIGIKLLDKFGIKLFNHLSPKDFIVHASSNILKKTIDIMKRSELTLPLLTHILENPCCSDDMVDRLLHSFVLTGEMHQALAYKCQHAPLFDNFLAILPSEKALQILCKQQGLLEKQLLTILQQVKEVETLVLVQHHPAAKEAVRKALIPHQAHSAESIISCLFKMNLSTKELLEVLNHPRAINEQVLIDALKLSTAPDIQLAAIRHAKSTSLVWEIVLKHSFLPEILSEVIQSTRLPRDHAFLKKTLKQVFQASLQSSEKEKWETILIQLMNKYSFAKELSLELITIIKEQNKHLSPTFRIKLLEICGPALFQHLPFEDFIAHANSDLLRTLLSIHKFYLFSDEQMILIIQKFYEQDLIDNFIKQVDLSPKLSLAILAANGASSLSEAQLLLMLAKQTEGSALAAFYKHPASTSLVRTIIHQHKHLSSAIILSLLTEKLLDDKALIEIIAMKKTLSQELLNKIISKTTNPLVLKTIIQHIQFNTATLGRIIDNPIFSPLLAQEIINTCDAEVVLKKLMDKCFSEATKTEGLQEWDAYLSRIIERYRYESFIRSNLKVLLGQYKEGLSSQLGFKILDLFGQELASELPLKKMILDVNDTEELSILLNPETIHWLSSDLLIVLAKKCHSESLIDQFLKRKDLTDEVLEVLLEKETLNEQQLLLIGEKIETSATLQKLLNHKALKNKLPIYKHKALSFELLDNLIKEGGLDEDDLEQILKDTRAVDDVILTQIAEKVVSDKILNKVAEHPRANLDVKSRLIENPNLSCTLAQTMIAQSQLNQHELLKKLANKSFQRVRIDLDQTQEWENCLIQIFEKYPNTEHVAEMKGMIQQARISSPRLGFHFFRLFGKELLVHLPLSAMINTANYGQVKRLVDKEQAGLFSNAHLNALAKKCSSQSLLQTFLQRSELSAETIQIALDQNPNYVNLNTALRHANFSEIDRQNWLTTMADNLAIQQSQALSQKLKMAAALEALRLKACQHAVKALGSEEYIPVANSAIQLYRTLKYEIENQSPDYQRNCTQAIEAAKPILGEHRGYKKLWTDILNLILTACTFKFLWSDNWRFFEPPTATMEAAERVQEYLPVVG